jgi:hypothetical protein
MKRRLVARDVEVESLDALRARADRDPRARLDVLRGEAAEDVVEQRVRTYLTAVERQGEARATPC